MAVLAPERIGGAVGPGRPATPRRDERRPVTGSGRTGSRRVLRRTTAVCVALVVVSLLMVVGADAYLTQGQVRLTRMQSQLSSLSGTYRDRELRVAQLLNPTRMVSGAEGDGLDPPGHVTDLPQVTAPPATTTSHSALPSTQSHDGR